VVNRGTSRARDIGKVDVLHLEPGDLVSFFSPSGGGHGDPRRRDPEAVRADVRAGFLSVERARQAYGIELVDGHIDAEATARLRAAMPAPSNGMFDFGERRAEMERGWPPAIQDAAHRVLGSVPPAVRDWGKHQIYEKIREIAAARPPTTADVDAAWSDIRARLVRALGEA
jgi:N-methylhydantoinase B